MSTSAAPVSPRQRFIESLHLSQLFAPEVLKEWLDQYQDDEPTKIASAMIKAGTITQFQAKQLLAGRHRGFFLGQYKILDQLGQGGMGAVYIAEHTTLQRKVAIKVLHKDKSRDQKSLERFFREARSAAALDHPNIVRLHDIAQGSGVHFLVMEYVEGVTLYHLLERTGAMHYTQAVQYAAQVAAGLQHAHEKGFVHRDIKPANLILEKGGQVKILDMGLARSYDNPQDDLTANFNEDSVQGTVDYISPEQAVKGKVDSRSDIYSLGATLFSFITGHAPFAGTTAQKLMGHQLTDPPKLSKLRATVPTSLNGVVARMMAKNPDQRYQSCSEVIEALAPWLPVETLNSVVRTPNKSSALDSESPATDRKKTSLTKKTKKAKKAFWKQYAIHLSAGAFGLLIAIALLVSALSKVGSTDKPITMTSTSSRIPVNNEPANETPPTQPASRPAANPKTVIEFDPGMLAAFNNEAEATNILGRKWSGWATNTYDQNVKAVYATKQFDEGLAIGVSVSGDKNAAQYAFRPHESSHRGKLKDGNRYRVHVTARTEGDTMGFMTIQTMNDWAILVSGTINNSGDTWRKATMDFVKPKGKEVQLCVGPGKPDGKFVWIKNVTIEALDEEVSSNDTTPPSSAATTPPSSPSTQSSSFPAGNLFALDLKKEPLFSMVKQGDDVVEGDGGMAQWYPVCEKGTKARFALKDSGSGRVFGLERVEGNGYIVYVLNLNDSLKNVPKGTHLQVDVEYTTERSGSGELKMQHGENYSSLVSEKLENSDGKWTQVSLFYDHNPQQKPQLAFGTGQGGIFIKNLKVKVEGL